MKEIFELLNEVDCSSVELGSIEHIGEDCEIDIEKLIEEVRDGSFTDRSDYNNLIDELALIENEVEVSDKEARNSNVIISENSVYRDS